ncbi:MAG: hypothetical protein IJ027_04015 [Oscillospiraceae bacterium]|nr:hypothetical protein [Oscillospiraceae bacterium]
MANGFSGEEIDRMKADAVRRARQMHARSTLPNFPADCQNQREAPQQKSEPVPKEVQSSPQNILGMFKMFGVDNDRLIIFALILLLYSDKKNLPIILALLYIAM